MLIPYSPAAKWGFFSKVCKSGLQWVLCWKLILVVGELSFLLWIESGKINPPATTKTLQGETNGELIFDLLILHKTITFSTILALSEC